MSNFAGELPVMKKAAGCAFLAGGVEVANGSSVSLAAQSGVFMGFCSLLSDTVLQSGAHIIEKVIPEEISQRFASMNIDIVQNLTTGVIYAVGGRYLRVSPMDDMTTMMGLLRSTAYATTVASASEAITRATGL